MISLTEHAEAAIRVRRLGRDIDALTFSLLNKTAKASKLNRRVHRLRKDYQLLQSALEDELLSNFPHVQGFPHYDDKDLRKLVEATGGTVESDGEGL